MPDYAFDDVSNAHTGLDVPCKTVATTEGSSRPPLNRPLMVISRVYVKPDSGVGPDASELVSFSTVVFTPKTHAVPMDTQLRVDSSIWQVHATDAGGQTESPSSSHEISQSSVNASSILQGNSSRRVSVVSRHRWSDERGMFDATVAEQSTSCTSYNVSMAMHAMTNAQQDVGHVQHMHASDGEASAKTTQLLPANMPGDFDPCVQSLVGMSQCSGKGSWDVCCQYVQSWSTMNCWCSTSGKLLLESMPGVLTPTMLQVLSWICETS